MYQKIEKLCKNEKSCIRNDELLTESLGNDDEDDQKPVSSEKTRTTSLFTSSFALFCRNTPLFISILCKISSSC